MKLITLKKANKIHPDYGKVEEVKFHFLGFHFWTEINPIPEEEQPIKMNYELQEITGSNPLSNDQFDKFQNQKKIKL